jgi:hypothetical protein
VLGRSPSPENVRHQAAVARVEMLHHDDRGREVRRQPSQNLAQSGNATSGRCQGDHVKGRTVKRSGLFLKLDLIRLG